MPQIDIVIFLSAIISIILFFYFSSSYSQFSNHTITGLGNVSAYVHTNLNAMFNIKIVKNLGFFFSLEFLILLTSSTINSKPAQIGFQTPASMNMAAIICTHNDIYYFLSVILSIVSWLIVVSLYKFTKHVTPFSDFEVNWWKDPKNAAQLFDSCTTLEILWTVIPTLVLLFIGYPNISLLYALDQVPRTWFNIKIIGHQWYWTYEYSTLGTKSNRLSYDSTLSDERNIFFRLDLQKRKISALKSSSFFKDFKKEPELDLKYIMVDNPLIIPAHFNIQAIVSSADVLHSWAVPALGVKIDACPGRLNRVIFRADIDSRIYQFAFKSGVLKRMAAMKKPFFVGYWGQCSELCGIGHGFMPIVVHAIERKNLLHIFSYIFNQKIHSSILTQAGIKAVLQNYNYLKSLQAKGHETNKDISRSLVALGRYLDSIKFNKFNKYYGIKPWVIDNNGHTGPKTFHLYPITHITADWKTIILQLNGLRMYNAKNFLDKDHIDRKGYEVLNKLMFLPTWDILEDNQSKSNYY